jgi:hypothetical protein
MTWQQREEMKKFAWFVFKEATNNFVEIRDVLDSYIQDIANQAYADGLGDSKDRFIEDARKKLHEVVDKL